MTHLTKENPMTTPYTADELADLHRALDDGDVHPWDLTDDDFRRVLAAAERAEKSRAALVAKVKRLEDRLAVGLGALPAGDVRQGWAAAVARADQAEAIIKAAHDLLSNGPIDGPGPWLGALEDAVRTYYGDPADPEEPS